MARIAVFDSGLGSLSVIRAIREEVKCEIIYLADQKNFPYGLKRRAELKKIIGDTICMLEERFGPDLIVVGSNTPSILLDVESPRVLAVKPPIKRAQRESASKSIAILTTQAMVKSRSLPAYIQSQRISDVIKIHKVNCSDLVGLVESGDFLNDVEKTRKVIRATLERRFRKDGIDVATLSSTHLPFLRGLLEELFPEIKFLDPARDIAMEIGKKVSPAKKNSLRIYSTDETGAFGDNLKRLGIKNKVTFL